MYTQGLCTRKISKWEAMLVIFTLNIFPGLALGYIKSIELIIMSHGGNYGQQALLSLTCYALCFKFLFAPLIDTYYLAYIGKNKSYIVSLGLLCGALLLLYAPRADKAVDNKEIGFITIFWLFTNLLVNVEASAIESWTLSICEKEYRKYMPIMLLTGFCLGYGISFNAFVCFNDVKWINDMFYKGKDVVKTPWLSHYRFCKIMGAVSSILSLYVLFMIKEKIITGNEDDDEEQQNQTPGANYRGENDGNELPAKQGQGAENLASGQTINGGIGGGHDGNPFDQPTDRDEGQESSESRQIRRRGDVAQIKGFKGIMCQFLPKMFKNRGMRILAFHICISRFFFELYKRSLELRLVENGLPKAMLAEVNTILFPLIFLGGAISSRFLKSGSLMKKYHLAVTVDVLVCLHRFYLTLRLKDKSLDPKSLFWPLTVNYILGLAEHWTYYFWFAHLNQVITDIAYGSTIFGIFSSINNGSDWGVAPLGNEIIDIVERSFGKNGYDYIVGIFTVVAFLALFLTWRNTYILDEMGVEEYRIMSKTEEEDDQTGGVELAIGGNKNAMEPVNG